MGNKIASELVSALRLSTLGTTLCSRAGELPPAMVDIGSFPGVAKAMVRFNGDDNVFPNATITPLRSFNVTSVTYITRGQYLVTLNSEFLKYNLGTNYLVTGSLQTTTDRPTAANMFTVMTSNVAAQALTLSSFRIFTTCTSTSGVSAANARAINLAIF